MRFSPGIRLRPLAVLSAVCLAATLAAAPTVSLESDASSPLKAT